jgi:uncharacterized membrane protein
MQNGTTIAELAKQLLELDEGQLRPHEKAVIERAARRLAVSRNVSIEFQEGKTAGERLADRVAAVGGSWSFIVVFLLVLVGWMAFNTFVLMTEAFDPYPYILLNLTLSTLAAIQAPIILMSQNRAAVRDRLMATHDYEVNLKAEIEIAALHEKLDQIRTNELAALIQKMESARGGG